MGASCRSEAKPSAGEDTTLKATTVKNNSEESGAPAPAASSTKKPGGSAGEASGKPVVPESELLAALPGIDFTGVEPSKRSILLQVSEDAICDCGRPSTLGGCLKEAKPCELGRRMGELAVVLTRMGGTASEVTNFVESYYRDFSAKRRQHFTLNEAACKGPKDAPITLTEFADFECPYCGMTWPLFGEIVKELKGKVRLCFLNFPLSQHEHSREAAMIAIYAAEQGKFEEAASKIFSNQATLDGKNLLDYATELGLDRATVGALLEDGRYNEKLEAERLQGVKAGIEGTPSLFINGRRFTFPLDGALVLRAIDDEFAWIANGDKWALSPEAR